MHRTSPKRLLAAIAAALLAAVCLAPVVLVVGCDSTAPTLPIPPPAALTAPDADGIVTLSGTGAEPEAIIFAFDEDTEAGVIGKADPGGAYVLRLAAQSGHTISYWQRVGTQDSPTQSSVVP
jgi:hypothetical protein